MVGNLAIFPVNVEHIGRELGSYLTVSPARYSVTAPVLTKPFSHNVFTARDNVATFSGVIIKIAKTVISQPRNLLNSFYTFF